MAFSLSQTQARYDYPFPSHLIAVQPASPRDSAKLLVYDRDTKEATHAIFRDIGNFLEPGSLLVLNQTKVIPAKIEVRRSTGGTVSLLSLGIANGCIRAFSNRKLQVGEFLEIADGLGFTVDASLEKEWLLRPSFPIEELTATLHRYGSMPLPPYIKNTPLSREAQAREYQSVFAREEGSIAAPTASLHFTDQLLRDLHEHGIEIAYVTLHVHLGTFAPLTEEQWASGALHTEEYVIDDAAREQITRAKHERRPVIAVGTTVARTLESSADEFGEIVRPQGQTNLFIRDAYRFKMVDALITNFHVPRSSLLMLVASFLGDRETLLDLYHEAIAREYRLFSFGDAMLIV